RLAGPALGHLLAARPGRPGRGFLRGDRIVLPLASGVGLDGTVGPGALAVLPGGPALPAGVSVVPARWVGGSRGWPEVHHVVACPGRSPPGPANGCRRARAGLGGGR